MKSSFVSRAGVKLEHAINEFNIEPEGLVCADFGCSTGGFTDCLLQYGAVKVYAVDTGYGVLDWNLRNDSRVVVLERTNAMHVRLPEKCMLITNDTSWTKQIAILPNIIANLADNGIVVTLVKPHYEADPQKLINGRLPTELIKDVLHRVEEDFARFNFNVLGSVESPIRGEKGGNTEYLYYLRQD